MYCYSRDYATISAATITMRNSWHYPINIWVWINGIGPEYYPVPARDNRYIHDATLGHYYFEVYDMNWVPFPVSKPKEIQVKENSNIHLYVRERVELRDLRQA